MEIQLKKKKKRQPSPTPNKYTKQKNDKMEGGERKERLRVKEWEGNREGNNLGKFIQTEQHSFSYK